MSRPSSYYDPEERRGSSFIVPMPDSARNVLPAVPSAFSHPGHHAIPASARQHRYSDLVELGDYRPAASPAVPPLFAKLDPHSGSRLPAAASSPHHAPMSLGRSTSLSANSRMAYSPQYSQSPPWHDPPQLPHAQYSPQPAQSNPMRRGMSYEAAPPVPSPYAALRTPALHPNRLSGEWSNSPQQPPELARHDSYSPSHYAAPSHASTSHANAFYSPHIPSPAHSRPPSSSTAHSQSSRAQAQPQPQQYYQSQQYLDSKHGAVASSSRRPSATRSAPDSSTSYHTGEEHYTGSPQKSSTGVARGRGKGFRRVRSIREVETIINSQPAGRRGDPETGGFISPLKAMTTHLPQTYRLVNPAFRYETSLNPRRVLTKPSKPAGNEGFDNEDSDYILYVNDILGPDDKDRYLILDVLGQGTFGQVVKCQNMDTHEIVAVKVVKNKPAYFQQSMMEVTILELINKTWDKDDEHHMLRLKDTFIHHEHLCLVFELLSNNLYELIKQNSFRGLSTSLVRVFTAQLLDALTVLEEAKIIHCDLKPENILLKSLQSPTIKVIDFGSACHERQTVYTYIQSRFYRSPEVILSLPYSASIDMWSLGCICVELFLGLPLFPGTSEFNQITRIVEMLGMPPNHMLEKGKQTSHFFDQLQDDYGRTTWRIKSLERYMKDHNVQEQPSKKYFSASTLPEIIKQYPISRKGLKEAEIEKEMNNRVAFIDFVQGLLHLDPALRWSPQQARMHPFVLGEPLTQPFSPPPTLKSNGMHPASKSVPPSPQLDQKRPYGGLPPAPQRSATRTYENAAAYNQHINLQQGYTAQAQQAAQRAAQIPTNPYQDSPSSQNQGSSYGSTSRDTMANQQHQQSSQQAPQFTNSFAYGPRTTHAGMAGNGLANPPPVHHYTSRGRSNTLTQEVPPSLQKFTNHLGVNAETGQSVTPVLRRDDQWQAWERIHGAGAQGMSRRVSVGRHPQLDFLQEQAESGLVWASPHRSKTGGGPAAYSAYYQSPTQSQQPFSVVVDSRPPPDLFDAIAAPPQAYSTATSSRYPPHPAILPPVNQSSQQQQHHVNTSPYDLPISFDNTFDRRNSLGSLYQPLQPYQQQSSPNHPPLSSSNPSAQHSQSGSPYYPNPNQQQQQQRMGGNTLPAALGIGIIGVGGQQQGKRPAGETWPR